MLKLSIFALIITTIYFFYFKKPANTSIVKVNIKDKLFSLEIAKSLAQKATGLSKRPTLCSNCGMIFVYQKEGIYPFWMKDTLIPLDIIWLNSKGEVVDIKTGKPHNLTPLTNQTPAMYIIELNPNVSNLNIGDSIEIPNI